MKKKMAYTILLFCLIIAFSCEKNSSYSGGPTGPGPVPPYLNTPPIVNAGKDQTVPVACNKAFLSGSAFDTTGSISSCSWRQLSGPNQCTIVSAFAINSFLTNIVTGIYQFELKVNDNSGAFATDTIEVTVVSMLSEIIFADLTWSFTPNDIPYDEARLTVPTRPDLFCDTTRQMQILVQPAGTSDWTPASKSYGSEYFYEIFWNTDLRVFGSNWLLGTKASVKIIFF
ncbi:MAG: hypothetical protein ABIT05_00210 [Chitinophagaceae bacterium]